jgi:protein-disulfide isomerase
MLASGSVIGGRFRVLRMLAPAPCSVALAEALDVTAQYWLVEIALSVGEAALSEALERHGRFALGVPGLARPVASGAAPGTAFLAFSAPAQGSVAEAPRAAWSAERVAALGTRIAAALAPLHDQGIAHGCLLPELVVEAALGEVLFGFGVAAVATAFGTAGEASQLAPPAYRAPELRASLVPPTPASDVFAFAVLLRGLLSPPTAAESRLPLAPELGALLARAEAPDPRARPEVRGFAREFAELAQRASTLTTAPAVAEPAVAEPAVAGPAVTAPALEATASDVPLSAPPELPPLPLVALPVAMPDAFREPVFAPPSAASTRRTGLIALLVVAAGFVVMIGAVAFAIAYATHRAAVLAKSLSVPASPAVRPAPRLGLPAPVPAPLAPAPAAPSDVDQPPLPARTPDVGLSPAERRAPRSHAPMVAPGVGLSSFPEEARVALPIAGSEPIWGTRNAALTWVFFGDLECPYTRRAWRELEAVKASFGDDLRIVFRHRPLREHPNAERAARVLAGLARRKGSQAFFDVLQRVMQGENELTDERLRTELVAAGFADLKLSDLSHAGEAAVLADQQLAGQFAVKSTPFSFLNGQAVDGERSFGEVQKLLSDEQRSATWLTAAGIPASSLYATRTASNLIGVGDPVEARSCVPIAASPTRGPGDALVTLVEFADFECPYCRGAEPTLKALLAHYPKTLRVVWKDYPLPQHKSAMLLANFAADAHRRGANAGFWAVHDGLIALPDVPDDGALGVVAGKAGLDGALVLISAHNGVHDAEIRAEMALGQKLGVAGTPTFFANGRRIEGALPLARFDALIQEELKTAQRIVARGTAAKDVYRLACD